MEALVVGELHGKLDIVLRGRGEFDVNGFEKLELINLGHRSMTLLLAHYYFHMEKRDGVARSNTRIQRHVQRNFRR